MLLPTNHETKARLMATLDTDLQRLSFYYREGAILRPRATFPATPIHEKLFRHIEDVEQEVTRLRVKGNDAKALLRQMIEYLELAPHMGVCLSMAQDALKALEANDGPADPA